MVLSTAEVKEQILRFVKQVGQHVRVERAILFGSYAYGHPHSDSDIDLAIVSSDFSDMTRLKRLELLEEAAWSVHTHKIEALGFTRQELQEADAANVLSEIRDRGVQIALTVEPKPSVVQEEKSTYPIEEIKDE